MEKKNSPDEIDLLKLFIDAVNVLRTNIWVIAAFIVLGLGLGWLKYSTDRPVFENKMVVSSGILTKSYGKILIDKVNRYRSENNVEALSKELKISQDAIRSIRHLKIEDLSPAEENKETERFIVLAETYSQDKLGELQNGIVYFLENNEFAKVRVDQNKAYLKQVLSKIDLEIKDMEDFKVRILNGTFFQSVKGDVNFDPTVVNTKILELTKEKINLQNSFALANSVQVIDGFTAFEKPSRPKLPVMLAGGFIGGLVLAGLTILLKGVLRVVQEADAAKRRA